MPIPDMSEEKIQLLEKRQIAKQKITQIVNLIAVITAGGAEGIEVVAHQEGGYEMINNLIQTLATMIETQDREITQLTEYWFASMDHTEIIVNIIEKHTKKEPE